MGSLKKKIQIASFIWNELCTEITHKKISGRCTTEQNSKTKEWCFLTRRYTVSVAYNIFNRCLAHSSPVWNTVPQDWEKKKEEQNREKRRRKETRKGTVGVILCLLWNLILLKCPKRKLERLAVHLLAALHCLGTAGMITVKKQVCPPLSIKVLFFVLYESLEWEHHRELRWFKSEIQLRKKTQDISSAQ